MNIKEKAIQGIDEVKLYWKTPPHGRYMSFKEIVSLSVGGMGVKFIVFCVQNMILAVGNTLIGNTIGIAPKPLYVIYLLSVLASFPLTALRAKIIDNSTDKKGKYRPYILKMGIPTVILAIAFTWMPYGKMTSLEKCIVVLLFNIGFQFFYNFLFDAYDSITNVLSPNTIERSDVNSIRTVVDSFASTIGNIILPLLARVITGEDTLFDMRIYRVIYPPMLIIGLAMAILIHANTKEKIVQAKTHVVQIKFIDAFRAIIRNKYFWIISLAGWLGFLEGSVSSILSWLYNYQGACNAAQYSLITIISGNASLWPMLFAPYLVRKMGKRNILVISNLLNVVFIILMYPVILHSPKEKVIWYILIFTFLNWFAATMSNILTPSLNGDIRDYQQYITGERIDGMFAAVGLIGSVITLATSFVLPEIYDRAGLNKTVALSLGYDGSNYYDVLYNTMYFKQICSVVIIAAAIGALLNAIPYFFYDLSEVKQKAMVTVLKIRALFEDYGNNTLSDEALVEAIELIDESKKYVDKVKVNPSKENIKAARKSKNKEALKRAKDEYRKIKEENDKIEIAGFVIKEINKFYTPEVEEQVEEARALVLSGLDGLTKINGMSVAQAKHLPEITPEQKQIRKNVIEKARQEKYSKKVIKKYYPDGVTEFDITVFDKLFKAADETEEQLRNEKIKYSQSKESRDKAAAANHKKIIMQLNVKSAQIKKEIKKATSQNSVYNRAAKPYLDAKKLLIQRENYLHYDEIAEKYEESKQRATIAEIKRKEKIQKEKAEKSAYAAKLKEEKTKLKDNKNKKQ